LKVDLGVVRMLRVMMLLWMKKGKMDRIEVMVASLSL